MTPVLNHLDQQLVRGKLTKGSQISGKIHFPLETEKFGRFNTLRAYIILRFYREKRYLELINEPF